MEQLAKDLRAIVKKVAKQLRGIDEDTAARQPAAGEWSNKQILGHLIDSAANNNQRFVRAQRDESHDFPGYDQEDWVKIQGYQSRAWSELIALWEALNLHLADIIERIPADKLSTDCTIGGAPWMLEKIATGYVGHMQMHLDDLPVDVSDVRRYPFP